MLFRSDLDGGTLFTQFSHWVDIMYWIFGDIKNIQAKFADFNHQNTTTFEDSGFVRYQGIRSRGCGGSMVCRCLFQSRRLTGQGREILRRPSKPKIRIDVLTQQQRHQIDNV